MSGWTSRDWEGRQLEYMHKKELSEFCLEGSLLIWGYDYLPLQPFAKILRIGQDRSSEPQCSLCCGWL
jgi:hypothetical protein